MADNIIFRDGTSQRNRMLPALAPAYFSVEERSTEDLLRFAQKYARELKFYNLDNEVEGDWSGLLGTSEQDIHNILAFMENPAAFDHDPARKTWLTRPHLSLFLQFLEMLKAPKAQFDDLTRRHLEFYYRDVLRFGPKPWKADRVHVLFEPAKGAGALILSQGTLLQAGKDAKGKFLHYQTLFETVVNQARVSEIRRSFISLEGNNAGFLFADTVLQADKASEAKFQALGADLPLKNPVDPYLAKVGFMIESRSFWLVGGGTRIVYLLFAGTDATNADKMKKCFRFELSCANGKWHQPILETLEIIPEDLAGIIGGNSGFEGSAILKFTLDFSNGAPSLMPPTDLAGFKHPVLRAVMDQTAALDENGTKAAYKTVFNAIGVNKIGIAVVAEGLDSTIIRNDQAVLNPKAPFEPFGTYPTPKSTFTFTHPELCKKPVKNVSLDVAWRGLTDLGTLYQPYNAYLKDNAVNPYDFKVSLFEYTSNSGNSNEINLFSSGSNDSSFNAQFDHDLSGGFDSLPESDDPFDYPRYFGLRLMSDLLHRLYLPVLQWCTLDANASKCITPVLPPYTPAIQSFRVGYTSFESIGPNDAGFSHIHPFGILPASYVTNNDGSLFFTVLPFYKEDGCLYIGIDGFGGASDLNLLFQMWPRLSEQTEKMPEVALCYLKDDRWENLAAQVNILYDATKQLFQTGLVRLRLPEVSSLAHRMMPPGLYWLRAESFAGFADATGDIVAVHAQAMEAEFVNRDNTLEHLQRPLPPDSIKSLVLRNPLIKSLRQPYTSFGGRPEEAPERLYTRVSERLRHKQRALTAWDYERLVLEHFPEVYKVKCLLPWELGILDAGNSAGAARHAPLNPAAGAVTLVVIPDISNTAPSFPMEPRAPRALLNDIGLFLADYTSPFAKITVKNPRYEYVRYRMDIRFHQDYGPDIYLHEANEALKRHLSPWAYEQGADIPFGSRIYHSEVIYFLEKLPYVDYVLNFKLVRQYTDPADRYSGCFADPGYATASRPDAVLVSDPGHMIGVVPEDKYAPGTYRGVGYDRVGVDLTVYG